MPLGGCNFHTRGQYIRSHSTGEDVISLIVAIFLSEQLKAVWLKFGILDFRRKRLIGVGSTLTFVENDQGVGLVLVYLDILRKGLYSVVIVFASDQCIAWLDSSFASILCNPDFGSVRFFGLYLGACEIKTFLTTSRFADSHRVAIGLHRPGFVSLYIS